MGDGRWGKTARGNHRRAGQANCPTGNQATARRCRHLSPDPLPHFVAERETYSGRARSL